MQTLVPLNLQGALLTCQICEIKTWRQHVHLVFHGFNPAVLPNHTGAKCSSFESSSSDYRDNTNGSLFFSTFIRLVMLLPSQAPTVQGKQVIDTSYISDIGFRAESSSYNIIITCHLCLLCTINSANWTWYNRKFSRQSWYDKGATYTNNSP